MADNTTLNSGSGGDTLATDDIAGVKYPRGKIIIGADGTNDGDVSSANPLPTLHRSEIVDDAAFTPATTRVTMAGFEYDDTTPDSVDEGDGGAARMSARREVYVQLRDAAGNERGANVNASGQLAIAGPVTNAGTFAVQAAGDVAHDAVDSGNPVKVGGKAKESVFASVAAGDRAEFITDVYGRQFASVAGFKAHDDALGGITPDPFGPVIVGGFASATAPTAVSADGDAVRAWLDLNGRVQVGDGGGALTVDNGGTFAVQVSSALPTGTNAIGKLAANSGVDIGDVDVTSVTPGTAAGSLGKAEDAAHTSADVGVMALAVRQATATDLSAGGTDGDYEPLQVDASGRLHVNVGNTVTVGSHAVTNAGTFAVQVDGSALTALQLIDDPVITDDAAFTPATSKVMMAGFEADETATDSVDEGDAGAARMTLDRKQLVVSQPHTSGGLTIFRSIDIDETEEEVKGTAGQLYFVHCMNLHASSIRYLKFYNATAAVVVVGTTTPVLTFPVPANTSGAGFTFNVSHGLVFDTAITVAATTGVADNDTGAPGANECVVNIGYK